MARVNTTTVEMALQHPAFSAKWLAEWMHMCHKFRAAEGVWVHLMGNSPWVGTRDELTEHTLRYVYGAEQKAVSRAVQELERRRLISVTYIGGAGRRNPYIMEYKLR